MNGNHHLMFSTTAAMLLCLGLLWELKQEKLVTGPQFRVLILIGFVSWLLQMLFLSLTPVTGNFFFGFLAGLTAILAIYLCTVDTVRQGYVHGDAVSRVTLWTAIGAPIALCIAWISHTGTSAL